MYNMDKPTQISGTKYEHPGFVYANGYIYKCPISQLPGHESDTLTTEPPEWIFQY